MLLAGAVVFLACPPEPPDPLELPRAYVAAARGSVFVDDLDFFGHARMDYLVHPDEKVTVTRLRFWVQDADIIYRGPFGRRRGREALRCTTVATTGPVAGRLEGATTLLVPAGAASVSGVSFEERGPDGECPGLARLVTATNSADLEIVHDPAGDRFGIASTLSGRLGGESVTVRLALEGQFLNRPPEAEIGYGGPEVPVDRIQGGCPPLEPGNPPTTPANDPEGLRIRLLSVSSDRDGAWGRSDILREQWSHSEGGAFRRLAEGQIVDPVLFRPGVEHRLLLAVSDRYWAESRAICRFQVAEPEEG